MIIILYLSIGHIFWIIVWAFAKNRGIKIYSQLNSYLFRVLLWPVSVFSILVLLTVKSLAHIDKMLNSK